MADAPKRIWARRHASKLNSPWHDATPHGHIAGDINAHFGTINPFHEYIRADLSAAREAEAVAAGVRAGLLAAAFEASLHAAEMEHDQRHGGAMDVIDTIRAIAADPAEVAAIAASGKGGE